MRVLVLPSSDTPDLLVIDLTESSWYPTKDDFAYSHHITIK